MQLTKLSRCRILGEGLQVNTCATRKSAQVTPDKYIKLNTTSWIVDTRMLPLKEQAVFLHILASTGRNKIFTESVLHRYLYCTKGRAKKYIDALTKEGFIKVVDGKIIPVDIANYVVGSDKRPHIPNSLQEAVRKRDGETCRYCGTTDGPFHLDHIHPWVLGGKHTLGNLAVSCAPCNWSKGCKTVKEWRGSQG